MPSKLDRWRALSADERRQLTRLAALLPVIGAAVRCLGFARTYRWLGGAGGVRAAGRQDGADAVAVARRLAWLVSVASRHGPYRATCLRQSLALWWLLRRRGLAAALRIGVGKQAQRMRAHAWVELDGQVVNDQPGVAGDYAAYRDLHERLPDAPRTT